MPKQDLMALDCIPDLMAAGVACLKIEGRLKGPEYVAVTTAAYRQAVDAAWEQLCGVEPELAAVPNQAAAPDLAPARAAAAAAVGAAQRRDLHQVQVPVSKPFATFFELLLYACRLASRF